MITRDPFCHPWKRARRVIDEALRRRFPIVLAVDERSCYGCKFAAEIQEAERVLWFTPTRDSCDEMLNTVVQATSTDYCLMVADDEEPSPALWDFAAKPLIPASYAVKVLTPTPDGRLYTLGTEIQIRLVERKQWRWIGGIDGHDDPSARAAIAHHLILWHYATFAPREFREAKLLRYIEYGATPEYGERHFWEDRYDAIVEIPEDLKRQLPK